MRLIDADELRKQFEDRSLEDFTYLHFINAIDNAPTVEQPQGEWINREAVSNTIFPFWERYECNQCHKFNGYSNFCPNCGAKMKGGEINE